ncbi:PilN domain-containing protein [Chloroflexota bacterium]
MNRKIRRQRQAAQSETTIRNLTEESRALEQERNTILAPKGSFTDNLRIITEVLPPRTYFTAIEISKKRITVRGETDTTFRIISYASELEAQNHFPEVRIAEIDESSSPHTGETGMATPEKGSDVVTFTIALSK